ncbi:MAG TPA: HigA family addiction module antitoxin [Hanamia sp.]|nr:HigA family addiction module antitoxin [Hanamia sp.]
MDKILGSNGKQIRVNIALIPGEVLREELEARNITQSAFAMKIGIYPSHFSDVLKGKRRLNASLALKLEEELGISAEFWVGLQADYELSKERGKYSKINDLL